MSRKNSFEQNITAEEQSIIDQKLKEVTEILYNNTPGEELAILKR